MGKKKNSDFQKIKVKIGKSKPSKNVTKFQIKSGKVVLRGDGGDKVTAEKEDESYLSTEKNDLAANLKRIDFALIEYIGKKKALMQGHPLDLTQSIWSTYYNYEWVTPWDDLVSEYTEKMGPWELWLFVILDNAANCQDVTVNEHMVRTIEIYFQFLGDTKDGFQAARPMLEIAIKYLKNSQRGKKLLGIEILSSLAEHCPMSLWYHARRRASIFVMQTLIDLFDGTKKQYEQILNEDKFIMLAHSLLYSVLDGRKAGSIVIGEDWTAIDDMVTPPFDGLVYEDDEESVDLMIKQVTDSKDKWDECILMKQASFNLEECLMIISGNIIEIGIKVFPLTIGCQDSLEKLIKVVKTLSRTCLRAQSAPLWIQFVNCLFTNYPFLYKEENVESKVVQNESLLSLDKLSKKEKKLKRKRLELEAKMIELCQQSKKVKNVKVVHKLNDELNYYTVALVHQSLVSDKIVVEDRFMKWLSSVKDYITSLDRSNNDVLNKWLMLAKQMFCLTFDKSSLSSLPLCEILADFTRDVFITAHPLSKVKRLSLAVYIEFCLGCLKLCSHQTSFKSFIPKFDGTFIRLLIDMVLEERNSNGDIGHESRHPTYVSSQTHVDITLPKTVYHLLLVNYPEVADIINDMDHETKSSLKCIMNVLRREMKAAEYPEPKRTWNTFRNEHLKYVPTKYLWDYFTFDNVSRKDGPVEHFKPLCSSVATFIVK